MPLSEEDDFQVVVSGVCLNALLFRRIGLLHAEARDLAKSQIGKARQEAQLR